LRLKNRRETSRKEIRRPLPEGEKMYKISSKSDMEFRKINLFRRT